MERRVVTTTRDCPALLVPTGDPLLLPKDTFVTLTQELGSSFTIVWQGKMARVAGRDADALGMVYEPLKLPYSDNQCAPSPEHVQLALQSVFDPEIPVNVVDLGLIYETVINNDYVKITMTLTSPGCGMGPVLVEEIKDRVGEVPGVKSTDVEIVLDPPWSRDKMTDSAKLELGIF